MFDERPEYYAALIDRTLRVSISEEAAKNGRNHIGGFSYNPFITLAYHRKKPMELIDGALEGYATLRPDRFYGKTVGWVLRPSKISGRLRLLEKVTPYLYIQKPVAELMIDFLKFRQEESKSHNLSMEDRRNEEAKLVQALWDIRGNPQYPYIDPSVQYIAGLMEFGGMTILTSAGRPDAIVITVAGLPQELVKGMHRTFNTSVSQDREAMENLQNTFRVHGDEAASVIAAIKGNMQIRKPLANALLTYHRQRGRIKRTKRMHMTEEEQERKNQIMDTRMANFAKVKRLIAKYKQVGK